jgi:ribosomal protein S6--L-glutamate ligase
MHRGHFPYGHLDIIVTKNGNSYLGEINLRGGIKGAKISSEEYQEKVKTIHQLLLKKLI